MLGKPSTTEPQFHQALFRHFLFTQVLLEVYIF